MKVVVKQNTLLFETYRFFIKIQACILLVFVGNWDNRILATCLIIGKRKSPEVPELQLSFWPNKNRALIVTQSLPSCFNMLYILKNLPSNWCYQLQCYFFSIHMATTCVGEIHSPPNHSVQCAVIRYGGPDGQQLGNFIIQMKLTYITTSSRSGGIRVLHLCQRDFYCFPLPLKGPMTLQKWLCYKTK